MTINEFIRLLAQRKRQFEEDSELIATEKAYFILDGERFLNFEDVESRERFLYG